MMYNMAGQWSIGLLALALLPWVQALPSPTPLPTISQLSVISTPSPTPTQTLRRRATPSDTDDELDDPTSTSTASASVCGYFDGELYRSPVHCGSDQECMFHLPNQFPGLIGCCELSNSTDCSFTTACYDKDRFAATPSLSLTTDTLAVTCTGSWSHCASYTYPHLTIKDYLCGESQIEYTMSLSATGVDDGTFVIASKTISTVDDDFIRSWMSEPHTESREMKETSAISSSVAPSSTSPDAGSTKAPESSSSTSGGTIAGSVVGSIVGVGAIVGAGVLFVLFKKRRGEKDDRAPDDLAPEGYQSVSNPRSPSGWELDQPVKIEGASENDVNEMEGSRPAYNFSGQTGTDAANQTHEMDGTNCISELPAVRPPG